MYLEAAGSLFHIKLPQPALLRTAHKVGLQNAYNSPLFVAPHKDEYPEVTKRIRQELAKRYTVYDRENAIPADAISKENMGTSYEHGFRFAVSVRRLSRTKVEVKYDDYEAPLAGSDQTITYDWNGSDWKITSKSNLVVS